MMKIINISQSEICKHSGEITAVNKMLEIAPDQNFSSTHVISTSILPSTGKLYMIHSQKENTVSEKHDLKSSKGFLKILDRFLINYVIGKGYDKRSKHFMINTRKRNRPTFHGKTISCELTLEEVTQ